MRQWGHRLLHLQCKKNTPKGALSRQQSGCLTVLSVCCRSAVCPWPPTSSQQNQGQYWCVILFSPTVAGLLVELLGLMIFMMAYSATFVYTLWNVLTVLWSFIFPCYFVTLSDCLDPAQCMLLQGLNFPSGINKIYFYKQLEALALINMNQLDFVHLCVDFDLKY